MSILRRLFGRQDPNTALVPALAASAHGQPPRSASRKALESHDVQAIIPQGMEVIGDICSTRGAVIDGVLRGNISVSSQSAALMIRGAAVVIGNIKGGNVLVSGEVNGDIEADYVRLYAGARLCGRVQARRLVVDDGATIENDTFGVTAAASSVQAPAAPVQLLDYTRTAMRDNPRRIRSAQPGATI